MTTPPLTVPPLTVHKEGETGGCRWRIVSGGPFAGGYRWQILTPTDHLGGTRWHESSGAFYDGAEDHPEGGVAWAEASVTRLLEKSRLTE